MVFLLSWITHGILGTGFPAAQERDAAEIFMFLEKPGGSGKAQRENRR